MGIVIYLFLDIFDYFCIMKLRFSIQYGTSWGENIHVVIEYRRKDGSVKRHNLLMATQDGLWWNIETSAMESRQHPIESFSYYYQVEDSDGHVIRKEWTLVPRLYAFDTTKDFLLADSWREIPVQQHLFSNAYLTVVGSDRNEKTQAFRIPLYRRTLLFVIMAPQLKKGQAVAVCGSHPAIGGWNTSRYQKMQYVGQQRWMLAVNVVDMMMPLEFKYVVVDDSNGDFVAWEEGENRLVSEHAVSDGQVEVLDGGIIRIKEDMWRAAGVVVPVFSLRSEHSYGVGDFGDLKRFVDWVAKVGMKVIQILPVNDTTKRRDWSDSYPYNAISIYALHPHYIDLHAAGLLADKSKMNAYHRKQRELNSISYSDYEAVDRVKTSYLKELYSEQRDSLSKNKDYKKFIEDNSCWLDDYAIFCMKRDGASSPDFYYYSQYLLHMQLSEASRYARSKGVILKGDIPIGISRDSVEALSQPHLFNLDMQTGAPPDAFSQNGQNWGFPTYNWNAMEKDSCKWWRERFRHMEQYFDAFRIDHVLGFFRIWEIPENAVHGLLGHFSPSLPLTVGEIEYFGLQFRKEFFTCPFINDKVLDKFFGVHASYVRDTFLVKKSYGLYDLKSEYCTQKKVESYFDGQNDENSVWIRDGLYRLISNVLFLEDPHQPDMYHPRISVYNEPVYEVLNDSEKDSFMRLYNNYYYQRHNLFWGGLGTKRLSQVLDGTRMLVCAEDLGMLPNCVQPVLDAQRILTLEIQTMPKETGTEYSHIESNPYRSVATFSTHDMSPLRLWWQENPDRAQRYFVTMLQRQGRAPEQMPAHIAEEIVARHLYCPSMLCLMSLQDWLAIDGQLRNENVREERINVPSDVHNKWKYRMHITIEQLMNEERFNNKLSMMIKHSKR